MNQQGRVQELLKLEKMNPLLALHSGVTQKNVKTLLEIAVAIE